MKFIALLIIVVASIEIAQSGNTMKQPETLKTKLHVKDSNVMHFIKLNTRKDGKPVGILLKKSTLSEKMRKPRDLSQAEKEAGIIEIIGVRERDNEHDKENIYRNKVIINNTLTSYPSEYRPHKMERSNVKLPVS